MVAGYSVNTLDVRVLYEGRTHSASVPVALSVVDDSCNHVGAIV